MTNEERLILAQEPILWTGDLADDCLALWAGLMLRAEWMDEDYWWWAVYDMQRDEITIDDSNSYSERFIGGNISRLKAESIAINYISEITTQEKVAEFVIAETFKITNRGVVLAGNISSGRIFIGDSIEFIADYTLFRRKIISIDGFTKPKLEECIFGLMISCNRDEEIEFLRGWEPRNTLATIHRTICKDSV